MSPFSYKEGERWVQLKNSPVDIEFSDNENKLSVLAQIFPQENDSERIKIHVKGNVLTKMENGSVYYLCSEKDADVIDLVDRHSVLFKYAKTGQVKGVLYEKPVGKK